MSGVNDEDAVLTSVRKHLNTASNASSMCLGCFVEAAVVDKGLGVYK